LADELSCPLFAAAGERINDGSEECPNVATTSL
jgi:hypothetical protein